MRYVLIYTGFNSCRANGGNINTLGMKLINKVTEMGLLILLVSFDGD